MRCPLFLFALAAMSGPLLADDTLVVYLLDQRDAGRQIRFIDGAWNPDWQAPEAEVASRFEWNGIDRHGALSFGVKLPAKEVDAIVADALQRERTPEMEAAVDALVRGWGADGASEVVLTCLRGGAFIDEGYLWKYHQPSLDCSGNIGWQTYFQVYLGATTIDVIDNHYLIQSSIEVELREQRYSMPFEVVLSLPVKASPAQASLRFDIFPATFQLPASGGLPVPIVGWLAGQPFHPVGGSVFSPGDGVEELAGDTIELLYLGAGSTEAELLPGGQALRLVLRRAQRVARRCPLNRWLHRRPARPPIPLAVQGAWADGYDYSLQAQAYVNDGETRAPLETCHVQEMRGTAALTSDTRWADERFRLEFALLSDDGQIAGGLGGLVLDFGSER